MKCFIDKQVVLLRAPEGPVAEHIRPFAASLRERGYTLASIHRQVLLATCFCLWLKRKQVALRSITSDHPPQYLRYRARKLRRREGDAAALSRLLAFLRCERVIPTEKISSRPPTPAERCTQMYEHHLRDARGLAKATIINYVPFIRGFLADSFGHGPVILSHLSACDVMKFVKRQAPRLRPKRAKLLTSALRSFLQYVRYLGKAKTDLAAAVPAVANWSMSSIPRAIAADQVRQLLASIDRRQKWPAKRATIADGGWQSDRRVSAAWTAAKHQSARIFARQGARPRLSRLHWRWVDCAALPSARRY